MNEQPGFALDDPDSRTRSGALNVVRAKACGVERFERGLFGGFERLRALTYTSSIPMIAGLLRDFEFADFECVFGHNGVLSREAAEVLSFQRVVEQSLNEGFVGVAGASEDRLQHIYGRAAAGSARFFVVKDAIAHAKIYLLSSEDGRRRVIVGSANLSETAFSGRQAETLVMFDDDDVAWEHYLVQYEAVRDISTSRVAVGDGKARAKAREVRIEETPALRDAESDPSGVTLFVPAAAEDERAFSPPVIAHKVERVKPVFKKALADIKPDKEGRVSVTPRVVKQMSRITLARQGEDAPPTYLSRDGGRFALSGNEYSLDADPADVRSDVECWLEFFGNYERGFAGDVDRLRRDYWTFMCWFYFAPLMCDLRNFMMRRNAFSFDQPMFAILYGSSNCGKTRLIEGLMASMFDFPHMVNTRDFTASKLRGLQESYKRFPVVFDDVMGDRFRRHGPEVIKNETIENDEYPCFALSMNAETRGFQPEIFKRCLMIYTRTSLPGDKVAERNRLQKSVSGIRDRMGTALYRAYLGRAMNELDAALESEREDVDVLDLSSGILLGLFQENMVEGKALPDWCRLVTLRDYQERAFERPRRRLESLLSPEARSRARKPPEGFWTVSGDNVLVSVPVMGARAIKDDIPDWILDDTASVAGLIALNKAETEAFLGEALRRPRRWGIF